MYTHPYLLDRLHAVREHDLLEAARRARLVKAVDVASASNPRPNVWTRTRRQLARFGPHRQAPRRRIMPA